MTKSFNASAWAGAQAASTKANSSVTVKYLAATSDADYAPNIKEAEVDEKCSIIVGVGFLINWCNRCGCKRQTQQLTLQLLTQDGEDHGADGSVYPGTKFPNLKAASIQHQ
jgi:basic membrane protein A